MQMGPYIAISLIIIGGFLIGGGSYLLLKANTPLTDTFVEKFKDL
jgi:hypothetical protein